MSFTSTCAGLGRRVVVATWAIAAAAVGCSAETAGGGGGVVGPSSPQETSFASDASDPSALSGGSAGPGRGAAGGAATAGRSTGGGTGSLAGSGASANDNPSTSNPSGLGEDSCAGVHAKAERKMLPSDVIWAIDTSGSMSGSFPAIQQALNDFSSRVIAAGVDSRIILLAGAGLCVPAPLGSGQCGQDTGGGGLGAGVGGTPAPDTREPEFLHIDLPFGWTQGMNVILDNHNDYKHLLRPEAHVQFVLTEDGPPLLLPADVTDRIEGRGASPWDPPLAPGSWTFNGIVCVTGTGVGTCLIAMAVPDTTLALIQQTSGIVADLDLAGQPGGDPFAELLDKLATAVIIGAGISCEYEIPPPPPGEQFDRSLVNVVYTDSAGAEVTYPMVPEDTQCGANLGWKYDDPQQPSKVVLCPAACDAVQEDLQAQISVEFGCETVVLLE